MPHKHHSKRASVPVQIRRRIHASPLPSILPTNVHSLVNTHNEPTVLINSRQDIAVCSVMCFTENCHAGALLHQDCLPPHHTETSHKTKGVFLCELEVVPRHSTDLTRWCWRQSPFNCQETSPLSDWPLFYILQQAVVTEAAWQVSAHNMEMQTSYSDVMVLV